MMMVGLAFFLLTTLHMGCSSKADTQEELQITSKSPEASKIYTDGLEMYDRIRDDEARDLFLKAIEKDPEFAMAHLYLALIAISTADYQSHLQQAVNYAEGVSKGEQIMIQSQVAIADNDVVKGIKLREQVVEMYPHDKRLLLFLSLSYFGQDEDDKAIDQLEKAIEIDGDYAPAYNTLGYTYIQKREYQNAEKAFKNYVRLQPDEANSYDSLADLYTRMGRYEEAIENYRKAVALNPTFGFSQLKIGVSLVFMGKFEEGRKEIHKAIDMESSPGAKVDDMNQIARSYVYEGKPEEAIAAFGKSLKIAEEAGLPARVADIHLQKCNVYLLTGNLEQAELSLTQSNKVVMASDMMQSFKDNYTKQSFYQETIIAAKRQDFETAWTTADRYLLKIEAGNNPIELLNHQDLLGHIYYEKGDFTSAIHHFKMGEQEDPSTLYLMALSQSRTGDIKKADELLNKVANWNQNSQNYSFVRRDAIAAANN